MKTEECLKNFRMENEFRLEPHTLNQYIGIVEQLVKHTEKAFDTITKREIRNWLAHMAENKYSPASIQTKLVGLRAFFKYCWEENLIQQDPTKGIRSIKVEAQLPRYLRLEQLTKLRQLAEQSLSERALIEVLYATGVRVGELKAMKKSDINWSERSILIPRGKYKKGRIVLFTRQCVEHLKAYLDCRTDHMPYVFVNKYATNSICIDSTYKQFKFYSQQLGCKVTPHTLRYTFAVTLVQKGMSLEAIQELLGHIDQHTTQLYTKLYDHARKQMYDEWM